MINIFKKLFGRKEAKEAESLEYYDPTMNLPFYERVKVLSKGSRYDKKQARLAVYEENKRIFLEWKSGSKEFGFGDYREFLDGAKLYSHHYCVDDKGVYNASTQIGCINADCIDVAERLISMGYDPAILNLASAKHPGGGYHHGTSAQEESLCRSSNLVLSLYQYADPEIMPCVAESGVPIKQIGYPLDINYGGIYTPNVSFFRNGMRKFFTIRENPFRCDVITVAALSFTGLPDYSGEYETRFRSPSGGFTAEGEEIMLNKIRTIFRLGLDHGKNALVLGAFGCGAYKLPVPEVARLFQIVINEPEFINKFQTLVFAILEKNKGENGYNGKYASFYNTFGEYKFH